MGLVFLMVKDQTCELGLNLERSTEQRSRRHAASSTEEGTNWTSSWRNVHLFPTRNTVLLFGSNAAEVDYRLSIFERRHKFVGICKAFKVTTSKLNINLFNFAKAWLRPQVINAFRTLCRRNELKDMVKNKSSSTATNLRFLPDRDIYIQAVNLKLDYFEGVIIHSINRIFNLQFN